MLNYLTQDAGGRPDILIGFCSFVAITFAALMAICWGQGKLHARGERKRELQMHHDELDFVIGMLQEERMERECEA
jgi:hypothetical protein